MDVALPRRVLYVPELKLWFGFAAEDQNLLAAADLCAMDSDSQPQVLDSWKELETPKGWQQVRGPQLVSLGSRRFCIARFFRTGTAMDDCPWCQCHPWQSGSVSSHPPLNAEGASVPEGEEADVGRSKSRRPKKVNPKYIGNVWMA